MNAAVLAPVNPVRTRLMWPLAVTLVLLLAVVALFLWRQHEQRMQEAIGERIEDITAQLLTIQTQQQAVMRALLGVIATDGELRSALRTRDRDRLLSRNRGFFESLQREYGITLFQFHDSERYNILRMQFPDRNGDRIERHIARESERTGKPVGGLEFSAFNILTLRVIQPVFDDGELVGYVELGKRIDTVLRDLRIDDGIDVAVTVHKAVLNRADWEAGMRQSGAASDWDRYPHDVLQYSTLLPLPKGVLDAHLRVYDFADHGRLDIHMWTGGHALRVAFLPLIDAVGRDVGDLVVILDVSEKQLAFRRTTAMAGALGAGVLILLLGFLHTLLKNTDRQLLTQQSALRRTGGLLQAMFDTVVDGIVVIDERGRIELFNPCAQAIFGYQPEEVVGRNVSILMPEPDRGAHDGYIQRYLQSDEARIIGIGREVQGQRKDGSLFPLELAIAETCVDGRRLFTGMLRDISIRKRAERELIDAREAAERASRAKSEFLSSMSHELRTPMNAILGFGQLLESDHGLTDAQRDSVQEILKSGHHLLALINEVLDLARIESGNLKLTLEPVAVRALVESTLASVQPLAAQRSIAVSAEVPAEHAVMADPLRLRQVLLNLLSNAIKYNREGGYVRVSCQASAAGGVRICVHDSGQGVDADAMSRLFRPFERLESSYSGIEGAGIGLALSKHLVEGMCGSIGAESTPGVGSVFWCELMPAQALPAIVATSAACPSNAVCTAKRAQTLLCIEDNPANLRLFKRVLADCPGLTVVDARSAELGIELARAHRPDLILLDIALPGMDGFAALEQLRSDPRTRDIPVVAVSANAMPRDIKRGQAAGFADYLIKPVDVAHFHAVVDRWLGRTPPAEQSSEVVG